MHTTEEFFKPGLEPATDVMSQMMELPIPRAIHPAGQKFAIVWRILVFVLSVASCVYVCFLCYQNFLDTASFWSWFVIVAVVPVCFFFIPWQLVSSYCSAMRSFRYCKNIYENGRTALGTVQTLTCISGQNLVSHHTERNWSGSRAKVRVDYSFDIGNCTKVGTAMISEQNVNYLSMNSDVCVLFLPDNPSESMIFPIPGSEFFEYQRGDE